MKMKNSRSRSRPIEDIHDAIQEAIEALARDDRIVDTGRRRFSERTGRYEIVWAAVEHAGKRH